ncbi:TniQ family protein [Deinococcus radiomollis]|uniref:TniQ family protein n=1 Tax=Deinococcus radiomollis TaxID=468916 RepID=UPI0038925302
MRPGRRLPRHPQPYADELLTSWLIRLAAANGHRLPSLAFHLFGDRSVWSADPDRVFNADNRERLIQATGVPGETVDRMLLNRFEGRLSDRLVGSASPWLLVLSKLGYHGTRRSHLYCPACLADAVSPDDVSPHLSIFWRLAFMTSCPRHGTLLRDACPHCGAIFAPALNDLGPGRDWRRNRHLLFAWCHQCGRDLRVETPPASGEERAFQGRLLGALEHGVMSWSNLGDVPALEGFEVMRQLLNLLFLAGPQHLVSASVPGPEAYPEGSYRMLRDFDLPGRRALLRQLDFLTLDWPTRVLDVARRSQLTRKPMVAHLQQIPLWYDTVADQLHQGNGHRRLLKPLVAHLDLAGIEHWRDHALSAEERRRWAILWHYAQEPNKQAVATRLGVRWALVSRTVATYNAGGPAALQDPRVGRANPGKRLLTPSQEEDLRALLLTTPVSNSELADWIEAQSGRRPADSTVRMYRQDRAVHLRSPEKQARTALKGEYMPIGGSHIRPPVTEES